MSPHLTIGRRSGPGEPPFVIAELSANHLAGTPRRWELIR